MDYIEEAEKAVIGSILLSPERFLEVKHIISHEDFLDPLLAIAFQCYQHLFTSGIAIDEITLGRELNKVEALEKDEISSFLLDVPMSVPNSSNAEYYAEIILKESSRRRLLELITMAHEEVKVIDNPVLAAGDLREKLNSVIKRQSLDAPKAIKQVIQESESTDGHPVSTGYPKLDVALGGGIDPVSFTALAGGPSTGKSQFAVNLIAKGTVNNKPARSLYICQEMSSKTIQDRLISAVSGVPLQASKNLRLGLAKDYTVENFSKPYNEGLEYISTLPISIYANGCLTFNQLASVVLRNIDNVDIIYIDYLQQIKKTNVMQKDYDKVSEISGFCMDTASRHSVPIVGLSQFNRDGYKDGKRPTKANLRDSGQLEQDAENVWLLWRDPKNKDPEAHLEVIIDKNRNGPTGTVFFKYMMKKGQIVPESEWAGQ